MTREIQWFIEILYKQSKKDRKELKVSRLTISLLNPCELIVNTAIVPEEIV
jgi:hypothetical protein